MIIYRTCSADPIAILCWDSIPKYFRQLTKYHPSWPSLSCLLQPFYVIFGLQMEMLFVFLFALLFTLLRYKLQWMSAEWVIRWKVLPRYSHKLPECIWKLLYYGISWLFSLYVHMYYVNTFNDPLSMWDEWEEDSFVINAPRIHLSIIIIYATQTAFYLHSIYATLFMDQWRSDSWVMFIHHFIAIILLSLSYAENYTLAGAFVLFLQDNSDAALEITKLCVYLKRREDGRFYRILERIGNFVLYSFGIIWIIFRLWFYSSKLLYGTLYGGSLLGPKDSLSFPILAVLLISILILNIFWFNFIVRMCIRVWKTGKEPEDNREYDNDRTNEIMIRKKII